MSRCWSDAKAGIGRVFPVDDLRSRTPDNLTSRITGEGGMRLSHLRDDDGT